MSSSTWLILDLETTGLNPQKGDVIIDIAAIKGDHTGITETFQSYVHPGDKEVSSFVQTLTGISLETLQNAPSDNDVLQQFKAFLGETDYTIIGHNIGFDVDFLRYYGIQLNSERLLDTNDFATLFFPEAPSHSLEVLADLLEVEHTAKHTALGDVHATYELLQAMLSKYNAVYKDTYAPWLTSVLDRITSWGGKVFFEMSLPHRSYAMKTNAQLEHRYDLSAQSYKSDTLYIIPEYTDREIIVQEITKQTGSVLLLSHNAMDHYKRIHSDGVLFFDNPFSFLSKEKVAAFLKQDTYSTDEAVWAIRAHTLDLEHSIHTSRLPITYRERTYIQTFCIDASEVSKQEMQTYLETATSIVTTFYQYFFGEYSNALQNRENLVVASAAELVPDIAKAGRSLLDEDSYLWKIQRLKSIYSSSEHFSSIASSRDLDALEHVVHYFFQNLEKKRTNGGTRIQKESIYTYAPLFINSVQKAVDLLLPSTSSLSGSSKETANSLLIKIKEDTELFLGDSSEGYTLYGEYYNNAIHLIREYNQVEELCNRLIDKNCIYTDSRTLANFPYLCNFTSTETLLQKEISQDHNAQVCISPTLRAEDTEYLAEHINKEAKTLLLLSSATKCERVFDYMYEHMSSSGFVVLGHGKSGGSGKISYLFEKAPAGLLIQRPSDIRIDRLPSELSEIFLTALPFYIVQGKYFEEKYDRQTFGLFTLPLTYKSIADLIDKMQRLPQTVKVHILDDRMQSKGYGLELSAALEKEYYSR